jgi:hypothetical protein
MIGYGIFFEFTQHSDLGATFWLSKKGVREAD